MFRFFISNMNGGTVHGSDGRDLMLGLLGDDVLFGGEGNDYLFGLHGNDTLIGGNGDDILSGGNDDDVLSGGNGDDFLYGGSGDDILSGGSGYDHLFGGAGDDVLSGGGSAPNHHFNTLTGGSGADSFVMDGNAQIADFTRGEDKIRLEVDVEGLRHARLEDFYYTGDNPFVTVDEELTVENGYDTYLANGRPVTLLSFQGHDFNVIGLWPGQVTEDIFEFAETFNMQSGEIADFDTGMDKIRIDAADGATYDSLTDSSAIFNGVQQFLFIGQRGDDAFITYTDTSGGVSYGLTLANVDINDLTAANFDIV